MEIIESFRTFLNLLENSKLNSANFAAFLFIADAHLIIW